MLHISRHLYPGPGGSVGLGPASSHSGILHDSWYGRLDGVMNCLAKAPIGGRKGGDMIAGQAALTPEQAARRWARRVRRTVIGASLAIALVLAGFCYIGVFGGNVHTIEPGRAYRSATLTGMSYTGITAHLIGNDLDSVLKRDHIGTVICLRSGSNADDWYRQELGDCRRANALHEDVPISARSLPPPSALVRLIDIFDHARYPILLHCQAGADRTGLASTIYAHLYEGLPLDTAEAAQLTWRYGHFAVDKTRAMDTFFDLYRQDANGLSLRDWIRIRYPRLYSARSASPLAK